MMINHKQIRPEEELLLCCSRTCIDSETAKQLKNLLQKDIDWEYLVETATQHGVMPLLYWNLNQNCPDSVPKATLTQLEDSFLANARHSLALTSELVEILEQLAAAEIPAIPFKGPVLAASVYGNLALRQFGDLDILVSEQDGLKAKELLASGKYQLVDKILIGQRGITPINIDIQWRITKKEFGIPLNFQHLWERRKPILLGGTTVNTLSPENSLILLCIHGSKHFWERLTWICDIAEFIRIYQDLDWEKIIRRASKIGTRRMLFLGLFLSFNLLKSPLPGTVLQKINADLAVKYLAKQLSQKLFSDLVLEESASYRGEDNVIFIRMRERIRDRLKYFLLTQGSRWLIPNEKDREFLPLPRSLHFLYYLIRPFRLIGKYGLNPLKHLLGS